jgi:hypothetical protein
MHASVINATERRSRSETAQLSGWLQFKHVQFDVIAPGARNEICTKARL